MWGATLTTRYSILVIGLVVVYGCQRSDAHGPQQLGTTPVSRAGPISTPTGQSPGRTREPTDSAPPIFPDSTLTPGATFPVTAKDICTPGYAKAVRNVTAKTKREVFASYGITHHQPGDYEVDHLISLELGGSNSIKNLWPESYKTQPWNARVKDAVENRLHTMVCSGKIPLEQAQREIATDWIAAYKKYFGREVPDPAATR